MSIGSFFTKKIGPLPVWGYGAIAAGGTFILLKGGGGGGKAKGKGKAGSGPASGDGSDSMGGSSSFTGNTTETLSSDQTFGGGTLGFLGRPFGNWGNVIMHLHPHPQGGYQLGGQRYSHHAFASHGFGRGGRRDGGRGGSDHRHGAFGGRPFRGRNDGHGNGHARGFGQGHYTPSGGIGSKIARSFHPSNPGARGRSYSAKRTVNNDARPSNGGGRR